MYRVKKRSTRTSRALDLCLAAAAILILWQLLVWLSDTPPFILPGPWRVLQALVDNSALLLEHALVTAAEVILGLVLGTLLGAATALYLMASPGAQRILMPMLVLSQAVPVFALAPLLTLWFGYGLFGKVAMALLIIYFPVASTFYDGLRNTPPGYLSLAHTMRATPLRILLQVRVPAGLPALASGLRLAAVYAPIGAIIGEWVGASRGLGYLMLLANGRAKTDLMFAALVVLCVFTVLLRAGVGRLSQVVENWAGPVHTA